jgi:hypothetical protein
MVQLQLKKFDITKIEADKVVVFIGKRGTGKTFAVKDLLYYHRDIPVGTLISGTESANRTYSDNIPGIFIYDEYTPELLDKVMKRQELMMKRLNKEKMLYGKSSLDPRAFLILDDCLHDNTWVRDKNIRYAFLNGRHRKIFVIITMQYPLGITPNLRTNIDYVFIMRENNYQNRRRIYECYAGMFPTFDVFCSVMDSCTENFECLVIDNTAKSNKLQDQVFWYKADDHGAFTMCSREAWQMHNENINDNDDEEEEELYSPDMFKSRKSIPKISVKKGY